MKKLSLVLALIINILIVTPVFSQIDLKLIIRTPTPSEIYEWQKDPTIIQLIVNNQTTTEYPNATFGFRISNEEGIIIAESKYNSRSAPRFNIHPMPQIIILNGSQIIDINSISYNKDVMSTSYSSNVMSALIMPNTIPEGFYEICISVYDQYGKNITSGEEYCTNFTVLIPEPPIIISPTDDYILSNPFPNFIWTPVTNYSTSGNQIKYKLKICPVYEGQSPRTAIDRNPVLLEKTDILTSSYIYLPSNMPFDYFKDIERYVWMVQAFDVDGKPATKNQGRSELATFRIEKETVPTITLSNIYPDNKDTIPWDMPHLVSKFTPYSDDVSSVEFILTLKKDGENKEYTNTRTLTFAGGAKASQQLSTDDEASLIISNLDNNQAFPIWMPFLEKGVKYNWTVEAEFTKTDGSKETVISPETSFVIGFKKLKKTTYPSNDSLIVVKNKFDCSFQIPRPENLNFANNAVLNNESFHGYNSYSTASGKFSIEIAKKSSFDTIVQTQNFILPDDGAIKTGDDCNELYNKISKKIDGMQDTGKYYYRVNYLNNADQKYYISPAKSIKIVPDSLISCFEMLVEVPPNNGKWTTNKKPRFSVSVKPKINKSAITGGHIKVWKKTSATQSNVDAKKAKAVLDTTFTGNNDKKIFAYSAGMDGFTRYDLNFINGDSTSKSFTADTTSTYLWNFKLSYKKDSVRSDNELCDSNAVTSNDGIFKVSPTGELVDSGSCPGDCYATVPTNTTRGTQTLKKDSTITIGHFKLKLNTVSGPLDYLSGDGSIDVPYLRGNILVEFNGLKVNSDNEVYEGEAFGKIDENAPYSKSEGNDYEGKALNFVEGVAKFKEIHEYSSSSGKLVSALVGTTPVSLPIGFDHDWDGYKVVVGIIGMKFTPVKGTLNAAMYVELPSLGPEVGLGFGAKNVCFHKDGLDGKGKGILYLAQDFGYDSDESWSFLFKAPTPADSGTYAIWDCKGFNQLVIAADVEFPRSWMKPTPDPDPTKMVKAHFKTRADKSGNGWQWMASANLDECELSGAEGYKMQVQEMVFDFSIDRNPEGIIFPKKYTKDKTVKWTGFYIKRATIAFPDKIKTFEDASPILSVNHVIIDKTGFTASIWGENVFQYPKGNFGGWGGSIDTIKIDFVSSSLQSGSMKGRIKVSIFDTSLVYTGLIAKAATGSKLHYQFLIVPKDSVSTDIWKSKLQLSSTSRIEIGDTLGKFRAQAVLSGSLKLENDVGGLSKVGFKGITFEQFKVMSISPYFDKGNWSFASPQHSMAGFPVSINNFDIVTGSRSGGFGAGLQFDLNIALQSGSDAISGTTKLSVWGKLATGSGAQHFVFDGVELDSVGVNADLGSVVIKGGLELYDSHSTFGDGFRGVVNANFVNQVSVMATAQFGSVNNYRYWYVDAKAIYNEAVPVFSGVGLYGFGGGAWYHMSRSGSADLSESASEPDASNTAGKTNSGYKYVPDQNVNLGLEASMVLGTLSSPKAFNGDVGMAVEFIQGGGIGTISLLGEGYFMCDITNRSKAKIIADLNLEYILSSKTFHGIFDVRIQNASPLEGNGRMVMHYDLNEWYIKMGEPANRMNISLASFAGVEGYFMMGQNLPSPQVPSEIQTQFPGYSVTRNSAIEMGNGFAFGASAGFETGRQTCSIFYGEISALVGFDMALLDYGVGTHCADMSGPIGLNGWYASGQIYASVAASIGLYVDLYFTSGNYEILNMQAGAILQGAGPNPTWVKGTVGGNYRILSGAVKGYCNFEFSHGDQCEIVVENPMSRIDLISDINPVSGITGVDVMTEPQVAMNFKLNKSFTLQEMPTGSGAPTLRTFRIKLKDFNLRKSSNNDSLSGRINIAPDEFSAYYSIHNMLSGNTNYKLNVSAYGEEYINGAWQPAVKNDGSLIVQTESTSFTTGKAPDKILQQNIAYTYPVNTQKYFLQDECRAGRIQLKQGQALFTNRLGYDKELIARFIPSDDNIQAIEVPFTYNSASKSIFFDIPNLLNEESYHIQIVRKDTPKESGDSPRKGKNESDDDVQSTKTQEKLMSKSESSSMYITRRKLSGKRARSDEKILYAMSFKTSKFNTLQAKLSTFNYISTESDFYDNILEVHKAAYEGDESFGYFDLNPVSWTSSGATHTFGPLVKTNGDFRRTSTWHNTFTNPLIYDKIQWMSQKGWWYMHVNGYSITEYLHYTSSSLNLVDIEANGYYTPTADESVVFEEGVYTESAQTSGAYTQASNTSAQTS
ncbi:MAG: hypothetical protein K8R31_12795, partial [Bacteroidales bacterium]|nr:hypothetical protein [Bacteroidales bacterium]